MIMRRTNLFTLLLLAGALLLSGGCNPGSATPTRSGEAGTPQTGLPTTTMTIGNKTFTLEVAATRKTREIGLMYRDTMPADHGMIFVFPKEQPLSFWMKHTRLPLDILFVDQAGKVVSVHQMQPFDISGTTAKGNSKYAIELNQGAATAAGVNAGDQLQIPADVASLKAEGY